MLKLLKKLAPTFGRSNPLVALNRTEPPERASGELLAMYKRSPWLRAVASKIARGVAETEWRVFQARREAGGRSGKDIQLVHGSYEVRERIVERKLDADEFQEIRDHPVLDLLTRGNSKLSGMEVLKLTQVYLDLIGEAFWIIQPDDEGKPHEIWPVPPTLVLDLPNRDHPYYKIRGQEGKMLEVPVTAVVPFIDSDPTNPYGRGTGLAKALGDELEIDEYAAKHVKSFFYNRARPDMLVFGENISPDDTKRMEQQWLQNHRGFMRAFKPMFLSRKVEVKELGQNMEQLQMPSIRRMERDTVVSVFSVPPELLGILGDAKRSTIVMADRFWQSEVLRPRIEILRASIQRKLIPMFGDDVVFHYHTPVLKDTEMEIELMKAAPWAFTFNDWRKKAGCKSWGNDGDKVLVPLNHEVKPLADL